MNLSLSGLLKGLGAGVTAEVEWNREQAEKNAERLNQFALLEAKHEYDRSLEGMRQGGQNLRHEQTIQSSRDLEDMRQGGQNLRHEQTIQNSRDLEGMRQFGQNLRQGQTIQSSIDLENLRSRNRIAETSYDHTMDVQNELFYQTHQLGNYAKTQAKLPQAVEKAYDEKMAAARSFITAVGTSMSHERASELQGKADALIREANDLLRDYLPDRLRQPVAATGVNPQPKGVGAQAAVAGDVDMAALLQSLLQAGKNKPQP